MSCTGTDYGACCPDWQEIERERSCTDVLFLLFFAGFWVGMVVVAYTGVAQGSWLFTPALSDSPQQRAKLAMLCLAVGRLGQARCGALADAYLIRWEQCSATSRANVRRAGEAGRRR